jgi:hypothetical protein
MKKTLKASGGLALALIMTACASDGVVYDSTYYAYEDPYLYDYYYTTDMFYSSYYWAYPWDYGYYVYQTTGDNQSNQRASIGTAVRALARGESICPGQVTVTPRTAPPACGATGEDAVRSGANIVFDNCKLSDGAMLSGTVDVQTTRTASQPTCGANTTISLQVNVAIGSMTYVAPEGGRLVITNETDTASSTFPYNQTPTQVTVDSKGRLQLYNSSGTTLSDHNFQGHRTITYSAANKSYAVSGNLDTEDNLAGGNATLTGTNITRTTGCCRPTGGTLMVDRTGGPRPGQHTWTFGPSCGDARQDDRSLTLPACL